MAEAFMSIAYHICPSNTNYQFDTTFMFVLAGLGIFKLIVSRSPHLDIPLHKILFVLALMIVLVVVGVVSDHVIVMWHSVYVTYTQLQLYSTKVFYSLFLIVYLLTTMMVTIEMYYHWQLKPTRASLKAFYKHFRQGPYCPPQHWVSKIQFS